jgi:hypothetical protein
MSTNETDPIKTPTPETNSFTTVTTAATTSPAARASVSGGQGDVEAGAAEMAAADVKTDTEKSAAELARETKDAAADRAAELTAQAKAEAAEMGDRAKGLAADGAEQAKGYASDTIAGQAETLRQAGREYGEDSYQAHAADYLATNLAQAADVLRHKDLGALGNDVATFARRNPALFLGGAALLGFAAARMMKATDRAAASGSAYDDPRFDPPAPGIDNTPYGNARQASVQNGRFPQ